MRKYVFGAIVVVVGVFIGIFLQPLISEDNIFNQIKKIDNVLQTATKNYVESVDTQKMVEAAIKGMLDELDPHSVYISADDMKKVNEDFQGSFEGIGIEFDVIEDTITVVTPIAGGPSESLGIRSGDKIVIIDGEDAVGIDRNDVPKKLKGPKGTVVKLDIKRVGVRDLLHFDIVRNTIPLYTVDTYFMIKGSDVGMIKVGRFAATTYDEFHSAMNKLKAEGMKKLILDLRGNPGGYLDQAYLMADEFLPAGDTIVYTKGRKSQFDETKIATRRGNFEKIPLIVMLDEGSASASEIVSGAIQDLDRGLIVGETSFGKGLVQRQFELMDGSAFRLTISKYYTPSGRWIQRPYKDKLAYRRLGGRLELDEGSNVEHTFDKIKNQIEKDTVNNITITKDYVILESKKEIPGKKGKHSIDSLPIYKTRSARPVLGGGGITPDYIIKGERYDIRNFPYSLWSKNLYTLFVDHYMNSKGNALREQFKDKFNEYNNSWVVSESLFNDFKKFCESKDVKWESDIKEEGKEYINNNLKALIARTIWDRGRFLEVLLTDEKIVQKSLGLFNEAEKIARVK